MASEKLAVSRCMHSVCMNMLADLIAFTVLLPARTMQPAKRATGLGKNLWLVMRTPPLLSYKLELFSYFAGWNLLLLPWRQKQSI